MRFIDYKLFHYCRKGTLNDVKRVLSKRANINVKNDVNETPLHYACYYNNFDIVKYLVENDANINTKDNNNNKPINNTSSAEIITFLKSNLFT